MRMQARAVALPATNSILARYLSGPAAPPARTFGKLSMGGSKRFGKGSRAFPVCCLRPSRGADPLSMGPPHARLASRLLAFVGGSGPRTVNEAVVGYLLAAAKLFQPTSLNGIAKIRQKRDIQPRCGDRPADNGNEFKRKRQTSLLSFESICRPQFSCCPISYIDASTASYLARYAIPGKPDPFL